MQATTISEVADFIRGIELIVTEVVEQWLQTLADPRARRLLHALYVEQDPAQVTAAIESLRDHPLGGGEAVLDSFYQAAAIGLNVYFFMLGEKSPDDIRAFIDDTIRGVPKIIIQISHEA